ncbi:unnamed protein product [Macrosiphum euphorbiae]|uniref:Uncharacterized protein n=1 Tax=Macrosiphum euphorbiae TaxID=13131 RepID=A0AAV0W764_9HEMI|nr:unnamed protein product [Macrosiphum euphorbiae]
MFRILPSQIPPTGFRRMRAVWLLSRRSGACDIPMRRVGKLAGPDVWRTGGGGTPSGQPDPTYDINPRKVEADR